jgi:hypothetical protein
MEDNNSHSLVLKMKYPSTTASLREGGAEREGEAKGNWMEQHGNNTKIKKIRIIIILVPRFPHPRTRRACSGCPKCAKCTVTGVEVYA